MCVSCTQWFPNQLTRFKVAFTDIECKQSCCLLTNIRQQNITRRTETRLLRKNPHKGHFTYRPRSLVKQLALKPTTNQPTETRLKIRHLLFLERLVVSHYPALSREAEVMVDKLIGHVSENINARFVWSGHWVCCKHVHFLTNGPRCGYTILQG